MCWAVERDIQWAVPMVEMKAVKRALKKAAMMGVSTADLKVASTDKMLVASLVRKKDETKAD